jgi:hypothetical protein
MIQKALPPFTASSPYVSISVRIDATTGSHVFAITEYFNHTCSRCFKLPNAMQIIKTQSLLPPFPCTSPSPMAQKALETLEHIHASRYKEARKAITTALDKRKDNAQYASLFVNEFRVD